MQKMGCTSDVLVFVNGKRGEYEDALRELSSIANPVWYSENNKGALGALNHIFERYPQEPWYGYIGDDEFVMTEGFEARLIDAAGSWDISHGNDGIQDGIRAQSYLCIGGELARSVGYLAIADCWHWYGFDKMWETIADARLCRKVYCEDVKVEHRHPYLDKGAHDECYRLGASKNEADFKAYRNWLNTEFPSVVDRVRAGRNAGA